MAKKELSEINVGMKASVKQLEHVVGKYIILLYDSIDDEEGTVVFVGDEQTDDYNNWFFQNKPITAIFHPAWELEENVVFDE